jgi:hypothetical protein
MSAPYEYIIEVTGTAESVNLFQRDIMDEEWYVDLTFETSNDKTFTLHLKATKSDLSEALDRATTNRDLTTQRPVEVVER